MTEEDRDEVPIHLTYGTRCQDTNDPAREKGSFLEGVVVGQDMLAFVNLALLATVCHPPILEFVKTWLEPALLGMAHVLRESQWFLEGHGIIGGRKDHHGVWLLIHAANGKSYIWAPASMIANIALEECLKAVHKCTDSYHVFLIPRLYSPLWLRLFFKLSNFVFHVSRGLRYWLASMHVQLFIGISLLMLSRFPGLLEECHCWWEWSKSCASCQIVVKPMEGIFCANFCKSQGRLQPCRKAWHANCYPYLGLEKFPVRATKDEQGNLWFQEEKRAHSLNHGVRGEHTSIPFQCDDCWMLNLERHLPVSVLDDTYVMCQANLYAMGGRAASTIGTHATAVKHADVVSLLAPSQRYSTIKDEEACRL
jgi:hypothetical protein